MPDEVSIQTGARLHFGLLSYGNPDLPQFGGIGMMVDRPGFHLHAAMAAADQFVGPDELLPRVAGLVEQYRLAGPDGKVPPRVRIEIRSAIPTHVGLGSGTQLGLAVARALATLAGGDETAAVTLAQRVGRGTRSAIGIGGFDRGGFLVDGGKRNASEISPLVARCNVPESWRALLVRPTDSRGLSGDEERAGFARLAPMSESTTSRLCRLIVMELLPALETGDFERFSASLFEFGMLVGEYFAPVQGGIFADSQMERLAAYVRGRGFAGVAQTSWGPTIAIFCRDQAAAESLSAEIARRREDSAYDCHIAVPLNQGANVGSGPRWKNA